MVSRARSLLDQYRNQGAKTLLEKARSVATLLLTPPPGPVRPGRSAIARRPDGTSPGTTAPDPADDDGEARGGSGGEDVLAGICANIALRDLNLVDNLLGQLEQMEAAEDDPDTLARLYGLDHLVTRLRRNSENLRVLSGQDAGGAGDDTASLLDVIRAALSSIEHYTRVAIGRVADLAVVGFAADDVGRLVAELLDNATVQSPPTTTVSISAHLTERGSVLLRMEDAGIGLPQERLAVLNDWLAASPVLDGSAIEHMGLAVVRRLAEKHGVRVWLGRRAPHGTTASVLLPSELVREAAAVTFARRSTSHGDTAESDGPGPAPNGRNLPSAPEVPQPDAVTGSGLPRRRTITAAAMSPDTATTTTVSGLPRRVPQSLRGTELAGDSIPEDLDGGRHHLLGDAGPPQPAPDDEAAGREQFLHDIGAFAEGEQAAREENRTDPTGEPTGDAHPDRVLDPDPVELHLKGTIGDD
jgi:hypothetical protein